MDIPNRLLEKDHPAEKLANLFWRAHYHAREAVRAEFIGTQRNHSELSKVASQSEADTIYGIDVIAESALLHFLEAHQPEAPPFLLIGEFEKGEAIPFGKGTPQYRVLLDPIDGTRLLMYKKSSGWILTGIAPEKGEATRLSDIFFALQTEIPPPKCLYADTLWASRLGGAHGIRINLLTDEQIPLFFDRDHATDLQHGFISFVNLFPQGKRLIATIEEEFLFSPTVLQSIAPQDVESASGSHDFSLENKGSKSGASIFEDQHLSTGGQLYALMIGQLRLVVDMRPVFNLRWRQQGEPTVLCAHPYDLATWLIAQGVGVALYSLKGNELDGPTHPTAEVGWIGFANARLAQRYLPTLLQIFRRYQFE
jgi:hypothetical protein